MSRARLEYACTARPRPGQSRVAASRANASITSSDRSSRSASSASMVSWMPERAARRASASTLGTNRCKTRARCNGEYRGSSAESLMEMLERSCGGRPAPAVPMTSMACSYDRRYRSASFRVRAPSPSMSNEHKPTSGSRALRCNASSMLRPTTNSPPMMRIARRTARRTSGSPRLARELAHPSGCIGLDRRVEIENPSGQHQPPGRGVHEQRFGPAGVRRPIAAGELFGDQAVRGRIVGDPQERLGNAHERDAFLVRQAKFLQESIEEWTLVAARPRTLHQCDAQRHCAVARPARELQFVQQALYRLILRPQRVLSRRCPQRLRRRVGGIVIDARRSWKTLRRCPAASIGKDAGERQRRG